MEGITVKIRVRKAAQMATATVALVVLSLSASPAFATTPEAPTAVAAILVEHPGGEEIAPGVISWDNGAVVLTLAGPATPDTIGTCATGQYCAWSGTAYTGAKLAFTACSSAGTSSSLSLLGGSVRSTANARSSGHVDAQDGSTLVFSMAAGTGHPANSSTLTSLVCFT